MSEQYRCKSCGYVFDMKDMMCSECGVGYFERLHWTKGGDGSHWEGCADVHWDCRIAQLEAELARRNEERNALADENRMLSERIQRLVDGAKSRDEIIARLKEDASELSKKFIEIDPDSGNKYCVYCHFSLDDGAFVKGGHAPDCPITLHRALMKEFEC